MHLRQPPPKREIARESVRRQREQAVAQLRELQRRAQQRKPADDIAAPHIAAFEEEDRRWHTTTTTDNKRVSEKVANFRDLQKREREAMPLFQTQDEQWRRIFGDDDKRKSKRQSE